MRCSLRDGTERGTIVWGNVETSIFPAEHSAVYYSTLIFFGMNNGPWKEWDKSIVKAGRSKQLWTIQNIFFIVETVA